MNQQCPPVIVTGLAATTLAAGQAAGDGIAHGHGQVAPGAQVASGRDAHAQEIARAVQHRDEPGPVHGAVADDDRTIGHGFLAGYDTRRGEYLWHGISSPGVDDDVRPR
jgi:hypothetical protein